MLKADTCKPNWVQLKSLKYINERVSWCRCHYHLICFHDIRLSSTIKTHFFLFCEKDWSLVISFKFHTYKWDSNAGFYDMNPTTRRYCMQKFTEHITSKFTSTFFARFIWNKGIIIASGLGPRAQLRKDSKSAVTWSIEQGARAGRGG